MEVARQQMYNSRNALHHDLQLPDGYGQLALGAHTR